MIKKYLQYIKESDNYKEVDDYISKLKKYFIFNDKTYMMIAEIDTYTIYEHYIVIKAIYEYDKERLKLIKSNRLIRLNKSRFEPFLFQSDNIDKCRKMIKKLFNNQNYLPSDNIKYIITKEYISPDNIHIRISIYEVIDKRYPEWISLYGDVPMVKLIRRYVEKPMFTDTHIGTKIYKRSKTIPLDDFSGLKNIVHKTDNLDDAINFFEILINTKKYNL